MIYTEYLTALQKILPKRLIYIPGISSLRRMLSFLSFLSTAITSLISLSLSEPPDWILFTFSRITSVLTEQSKIN